MTGFRPSEQIITEMYWEEGGGGGVRTGVRQTQQGAKPPLHSGLVPVACSTHRFEQQNGLQKLLVSKLPVFWELRFSVQFHSYWKCDTLCLLCRLV